MPYLSFWIFQGGFWRHNAIFTILRCKILLILIKCSYSKTQDARKDLEHFNPFSDVSYAYKRRSPYKGDIKLNLRFSILVFLGDYTGSITGSS